MVLHVIPFIWAATKFTVIAGAVKGTALSAVRLVQNGFDYEATLAQLEKDVQASKTFGVDTLKLVPALAKLRLSDDYAEISASAEALETVLAQLPASMRAGLNKSIGLEARIDTALKQGMNRCGVSLIAHALSDTETDVGVRLKALYFGLFLIGRSGTVLDKENAAAVLNGLIALHGARGRQDDRTATVCLALYASAQQNPTTTGKYILHDRHFQSIPEIVALYEFEQPGMTAAYIARALGDSITCHEHQTFLAFMNTYMTKQKTSAA